MGANLDAGAALPTAATFSTADPTSYNFTTSGSVYDSLGNPHVLSFYFVKTPTAGQWNTYASINDTAITNVDLGAGAGNPLVLNFDSNGALTTAMPLSASATVASAAQPPLDHDKAQWIVQIGRAKPPAGGWPHGAYQARVEVRRSGAVALSQAWETTL